MEKMMGRMLAVLSTALLASSLLMTAAEARGGGSFRSHNGGFGRGDAYIGGIGDHAVNGIDQNAMRRFDSSYPLFDWDYDPSCDDDWEPKWLWPSSCS